MTLLRTLFLIYIIFLPFTSAFSINAVISPPIIISLLIFIVYSSGVLLFQFELVLKNCFLLILCALCIIFSFLINDVGDKSINHLFLYLLSIFVLYLGVRNSAIVLVQNEIHFIYTILKYLSITVFISSFYAIMEFTLINIAGINISNYVFHALSEYEPIAFGFIRARSFIEESGHFALFLEALAPISIYYVITHSTKGALYRCIYIIVIIAALLVTFSSFGFVALLFSIAVFIYFSITTTASKKQNILLKSMTLLAIIIIFVFVFSGLSNLVFDVIQGKSFSSDSYQYRLERVQTALSHLGESSWLFGYGPASYDTLNIDSYISLYITMLLDSGIIAFSLFSIFLIKQFIIIIQLKNEKLKLCFIISLISTLAHYFYVGNYYYPWLWFLLGFIYVYHTYEKIHYKNE